MKNNDIKAAAYHYLKGYQRPESQITNIKEALVAKCDFDVCNDILAIDVEKKLNENVEPEQMADTLYGLVVGLNKTFNNIVALIIGKLKWLGKNMISVSTNYG